MRIPLIPFRTLRMASSTTKPPEKLICTAPHSSLCPSGLPSTRTSPFISTLLYSSPTLPPKSLTATVAPAGDKATHQADQYSKGTLSRNSLAPSPFAQFHTWFTAAGSTVHQPETVCLSTAALPSGSVSSRFVYLKELDARGFVVYSNWDTSRKAADLASNPQAALAFWWREVERQVRVEGRMERLSSAESQLYFGLRARGSKVGAHASRQSSVLPPAPDVAPNDDGRAVLDAQVKEVEGRFEGTRDEDIPVPDFWGGMRVVPTMVEFWQGRDSRLHDRFRYTFVGKGGEGDEGEGWKIERLSP